MCVEYSFPVCFSFLSFSDLESLLGGMGSTAILKLKTRCSKFFCCVNWWSAVISVSMLSCVVECM